MHNVKEDPQARVDGWHLGQTSRHYESSGRGAGTISTGIGDKGGVSYGEYQLSSREGTLREYLDQSRYGSQFTGLTPVTPAFDAKWKELARTDPGFGEDQREFIGRSHYTVQSKRLAAIGLDMDGRGRAVHDCVWSTSVQFRNLTTKVFREGLAEKFGPDYKLEALSDRQIIEAVQDYKFNHNQNLFSKSPRLHPGLLRRARSERDDLVDLAEAEQAVGRPLQQSDVARPLTTGRMQEADHGSDPLGRAEVKTAQSQLAHLGYTGRDGRLVDDDGHAGRNTRHAVEQYQRDHGLPVTGQLDLSTRTRLGIDDATMASSAHPAHRLFVQSVDAVRDLDRHLGVPSGPHSLALAGVAAVEAARSGMGRIDRIELGQDGIHARAVEFSRGADDWATNRTSQAFEVARAVGQPIETSSRQAAELMGAHAMKAHHMQHEQAPMRAPVM